MIHRTCGLALLVLMGLLCEPAAAAETYKKGDEIEVWFLNKWYPATVIATNARGDVLAEFEFVRKRQEAFKPENVRHAYESGALARARTWSDASGAFKVKAALLNVDDTEILLRKPDMSEIKVPLEKLSAADRSYLRKLEKELGPIAAKPPAEVEYFNEVAFADAQAWLQPNRVAIQPDALPSELKLKQGGVVFPRRDIFDGLGAIVSVGGPDSLLLAAVENSRKPTRLLWTSLARQKILGEQQLPEGEVVMDYHARSHRLLTFASVKSEASAWGEPVLSLWDVQPADKQAKAVIRWSVTQPQGHSYQPWARLLDGNTVLHRSSNQEYVLWDVEAKQLRYRLKQESFFGAPAALSGGKKYLVLPEDKRVRVFEAASGKLICTLPAEQGSSGVAVSPDGVQLAVLNRNQLSVWNLASPDAPPEVYQAEAIGTPLRASLAWASPDRVVVDDRELVLFSLPHKMALWSYEFDWSAVLDTPWRRLRDIVDGHLVYGASVDVAPGQRSLAVGAVSLPGPKVNDAAATTTRESLLVMKPGSGVRLELNLGEHQERVEAALKAEIQKNGWILQPDATNALVAEMKQGETQTTTYRMFRTGEEQSASITPHIATLLLRVGNQVAWQSGTSSGAPFVVSLQSGETVQSEVDKWNKPRPEFFETVDIPDSILDPAKRKGLGTTQVTNRGLIPK